MLISLLLTALFSSADDTCGISTIQQLREQAVGNKSGQLEQTISKCIDSFKLPMEASAQNLERCMQLSRQRFATHMQKQDNLVCLFNQRGGGADFQTCLGKLASLDAKASVAPVPGIDATRVSKAATYREVGRIVCINYFKTSITEKDCLGQMNLIQDFALKNHAKKLCDFVKTLQDQMNDKPSAN